MSPSLRNVLLGALVLTSSACVTINIYFPAAAAEKAADRIIDEVWQLREDAAVPAKPPAEEKKP
ncbi:MAG: hypothetical protein CVU19_04095 [Betaproteobacteria bacterium HGW-Betaproteobacteria-13]|jgi:hypothetical protein|uniref:Uncharacterized protein n=1 Tax=Parazoarcus communis TaxID=41977 RepID=A0A2U8H2T9_9RHOO|nr:hypothetical protein [Parazoarcus communis]AWI80262.1 hypothetical protein CEW87_13360 [Parazoarcus communis]PKO81987.1 MAG: hypothetical protein CVU19_04095 [Betaproteobacteria bacterium HGW-Betaproteobacteria-13]